MPGMDRRTRRVQRLFRVDHIRQRLIFDSDLFRGVLGLRAGLGDDCDHPFTGVAHLPDRERKPPHLRRVEPVHQGLGRFGQFLAGQHVVHARHLHRLDRIDRDDPRRRMLRGHQRDMQQAFERDIRDEAALARDEAAVFAHPAIGGDEF